VIDALGLPSRIAVSQSALGRLKQLGHPFGAVLLGTVELAFLQQPGGAATNAGTTKSADGVEVHRHHPDDAITTVYLACIWLVTRNR
jgi:hypothetical protein